MRDSVKMTFQHEINNQIGSVLETSGKGWRDRSMVSTTTKPLVHVIFMITSWKMLWCKSYIHAQFLRRLGSITFSNWPAPVESTICIDYRHVHTSTVEPISWESNMSSSGAYHLGLIYRSQCIAVSHVSHSQWTNQDSQSRRATHQSSTSSHRIHLPSLAI